MSDESPKYAEMLARSATAGTEAAYMLLVNILFRKGLLDIKNFDEIHREMTDMGGNYEHKPYERAAIERMSETFAMLRDDKI